MRQHFVAANVVLLTLCGCSSGDPQLIPPPTTSTHYSNSQTFPVDSESLLEANDHGFPLTSKAKQNHRTRFTSFDSNNLVTRNVSYLSETIVGYVDIDYVGTAKRQSRRYEQAGIDGVWFTADDEIFIYVDYQPNIPGVTSITYDNPGIDNTWFTADDRVRYYTSLTNTPGVGNFIYTYSIAGPDNVWFSNDDIIGWLEYRSEINLGEQQWAIYLDPGADNSWDSVADNRAFEHSLLQFDANGLHTRHIYYADAGTDLLAFTSDDNIRFYHDYTFDTFGRIEQNMRMVNAGIDNTWLTPDDEADSCKVQTRDANDLPVRAITYLVGPDQLCLTADDRIWGYHDDLYVNNQLDSSTSYYGSGTDNTWFTPDDIIVSVREYLPQN